jgi:hypothetical protein
MKFANLLLLVALATMAGCGSEGRVRPAQTTLRFFHASPNFGTFAMLRERLPAAIVEFGGGATATFDSGPYDFHLESSPPGLGVQPINHVTQSLDLSPGMQYTFVAVSPNDQPELLISAVPNLPAGSTNARYSIIHAHPTQGAMDVYLVAAGTPLNSVTAQGSLSFGPTAATFQVAPQALRLYLTPAGDPATVLFESTDLSVTAGSDHYFVVHATGGQTPIDFAVSEIFGTGLRIARQGEGALLRVVQGVDDRMARDIILDDGTTSPLFTAQPFGELSAYVPVSSAVPHTLKLTPVGAPGTEEATLEFTPLSGRYYTIVFAGDTTDGITGRSMIEDPRHVVNQASVYIINSAGLYDLLLVHILPPGSVVNPLFPRAVLAAPDFTGQRLSFAPSAYEITVQDSETLAIVAGPVPITLSERGLYGVLMLNAADNVTVDLEHFYDIP